MPLTTQSVMIDDSRQAGALTEIRITPAMIGAGVAALVDSEALDYQCFATPGLVREIVEATLSASCKYIVTGNR
jgi:hypothetical protein